MLHINDYFSKLKAAFASQANKKDVVIAVCEKVGVKIVPEQMEIRSGVLYLKINAAAKSVVFMKKAAILEEINQNLKPSVSDIR